MNLELKNKPLKHTYADLVISELQLNEKDLDILHNEHWQRLSSKFKYVPFVGHAEIKKKGKFVNFDNENGRLIRRPNLCSKNIYVYGGSTTFGYNVTDTQTCPHYLQELVNKNFCVYNHGRAYFYSKQENALFNNHLENQKKIDYAIFLDGVNERCGSFEFANVLSDSFDMLLGHKYEMWNHSLLNLLYTLPIIQYIHSHIFELRWINDQNNNILNVDNCNNQSAFPETITSDSASSYKIPLKILFEIRLRNRHSICVANNVVCFSFLQPFGGIHGIQINENLLEDSAKEIFEFKYLELKNAGDLVIDISSSLNNNNSLAYVDSLHYTPKSHKILANQIFEYINNQCKNCLINSI